MVKSFEFFSDRLNQNLTVEINIGANEDESWINSMEIIDETFDIVPEKSLSPDELRSINTLADEMASGFAYNNDSHFSEAQELINDSNGYMISEDENN